MDDGDATGRTEYFYNLSTREVEEGRQSPGDRLMGPYPTRAAAERALETAARRNEAWDEEDERWDDTGAGGPR